MREKKIKKKCILVFFLLIFCCLMILILYKKAVKDAKKVSEQTQEESIVFFVQDQLAFQKCPLPTFQRTQIKNFLMGREHLIRIANGVEEILCGHHHRLTLVADTAVKPLKVSWYSSNPEVLMIDRKTGEMTALLPGRTTILLEDKSGRVRDAVVVQVVEKPEFYEVPEEWYRLEHGASNDVVIMKMTEAFWKAPKYTAIKFPDTIAGKQVAQIEGLDRYLDRYPSTTALMLPSSIAYASGSWKIEQLFFYENSRIIIDMNNAHVNKLYLPESIVILGNCFDSKELQQVRVPASVKEIGCNVTDSDDYGIRCGGKVNFSVDGNNENYYSLFGVLYARSFQREGYQYGSEFYTIWTQSGYSMLMIYPAERKEAVYYVPEGIERIGERAFEGTKYLKKVVLPSTVTVIGAGAFTDCEGLEEIVIPASVTEFERFDHTGAEALEGSFVQNLTIVTPSGSAAEAYAIEHGIKYRNE